MSPRVLIEAISGPAHAAAKHAVDAMMTMPGSDRGDVARPRERAEGVKDDLSVARDDRCAGRQIGAPVSRSG